MICYRWLIKLVRCKLFFCLFTVLCSIANLFGQSRDTFIYYIHRKETKQSLLRADKELPSIVASVDRQTILDYYYDKANSFTISISEPITVSQAVKPEKWGFFQFPKIERNRNGIVIASWNMNPDDISSYGNRQIGRAFSDNEGKDWKIWNSSVERDNGVLLQNGERIVLHNPAAIDANFLKLPEQIGYHKDSYSGEEKIFYKYNDLSEELKGISFYRRKGVGKKWDLERSELIDGGLLRSVQRGLLSNYLEGSIKVLSNDNLIGAFYPTPHMDGTGRIVNSGVSFYKSTDNGKIWALSSRLDKIKRRHVVPNDKYYSASEPDIYIVDNKVICIVRTTDGFGNFPLYISESVDVGKSWSKPYPVTKHGVYPQFLKLENGLCVLSYGRPGVYFRLSLTGETKEWTNEISLIEASEGRDMLTCGYTGLLSISENKFLLIYSDFKDTDDSNRERKTIKVREISIVRN